MEGQIFKKLILFSFLLGVTFGGHLNPREEVQDSESGEKRMINGAPATLRNWRFIASLSYSEDANVQWKVCSASLLNRRWLVTAGHCVKNRDNVNIQPQQLKVKIPRESAAASSTGSWATDEFNVVEIRAHPGYRNRQYHDDVALIKLGEEAPSHMETISIYTGGHVCCCKVAGWGTTQIPWEPNTNYEISDSLREIDVPIGVPRDECTENLGSIFPADEDRKVFCAGYKSFDGKATCHGDSGSPLVCERGLRKVLYGIVLGGGGACIGNFTIYLDITRYQQWIDSVIGA